MRYLCATGEHIAVKKLAHQSAENQFHISQMKRFLAFGTAAIDHMA